MGEEIFFFFPLFSFQNIKMKSKSIFLSALLCFSSVLWFGSGFLFPFHLHQDIPREDLAKTADNLAWIKHSWVPLKRNKLTSDFSTHKAK